MNDKIGSRWKGRGRVDGEKQEISAAEAGNPEACSSFPLALFGAQNTQSMQAVEKTL